MKIEQLKNQIENNSYYLYNEKTKCFFTLYNSLTTDIRDAAYFHNIEDVYKFLKMYPKYEKYIILSIDRDKSLLVL